MSLDYHFLVEQEVGSSTYAFFGFNVTVFVQEVEVPKWGAFYIPSIVTLLNAVGTPRSLYLLVFWVLFENVMSMHRTMATIMGLLEVGRVNEWIVTEKLGDSLITESGDETPIKPSIRRIGQRIQFLELGMGAYLFLCGWYDLTYGRSHFFIYLFLQSIAFVVVGFGYVGIYVPDSQ
ncbi:unnamed protein product [Lupinus luteus]|uniref:Uncharacterized protein n=1 Tax=Lupinus luteus TaxID=3873 RepID=A0AAV1XI97_LUPLU